MTKNIKEAVRLTYTAAVKNGSGCGCGPSCCSPEDTLSFLDENYEKVEGYQEIADYSLGCGLPTEIANIQKGNTVLDLGSGAGNDVFIARNQVGELGKVIGVDFTAYSCDFGHPVLRKADTQSCLKRTVSPGINGHLVLLIPDIFLHRSFFQ